MITPVNEIDLFTNPAEFHAAVMVAIALGGLTVLCLVLLGVLIGMSIA